MLAILVRWLVLAVALWVADYLLSGIRIASWQALVIGALVLAIFNATVKPVLAILTLPVTSLTLGLFYLIVNAAAFALAAALVPGFDIETLGAAIGGALITSLVAWFLGAFAAG